MRPSQARFVTSCQQLLALGAVLAVLTPAASVVSLDVVQTPASPTADTPSLDALPRTDRFESQGRERATVPAGPVEAVVTEVPLTAEHAEADPEPTTGASRRVARSTERVTRTTLLSEPQPVRGYGAVGVTWSHEERVADDRIELQVRTATGGDWSGWTDLEYHEEHGPDPTSEEGLGTRPGTDPLFVGEVDQVQLRARAAEGLPDDMSLAVVAPGKSAEVAEEAAGLPAGQATPGTGAGNTEDAIELQAASAAPQPTIFTREQWGADERLRDGRPRYGTISAGFVHHTVNGNDYSRADVPGIIRSIYAYHTRSRGWSDVGYNFLVDKFGRIWEGRAGGVARPVVGAHTLGYNEDSFAMSAIGNFDTARPPVAMLRAYGSLFAWKLGLHGIDPLDASQSVNGSRFRAINGHRDAGSTACPGRYLYAELPSIRRYADAAGSATESPEPVVAKQVDSDLVGTPYPDLVVRRAKDGRGMILPTGGLSSFRKPSVVARSGWTGRQFLVTPDLTGDARVDLVTFAADGSLQVRPGLAGGSFGAVSRTARTFRGHQLVASVGDVDDNGRADFVARYQGHLVTLVQTRRGRFRAVSRDTDLRGHRQLVGAGDVTGDGRPDLWAQDHEGRLFLHRGLGRGRFAERTAVPGDWAGYDWLVGGVDYTGDAVPDLVARRTDGALMLLPSRGSGTVGHAHGPLRGPAGLSMLSGAGQLVGDPAPDLVAARADGALVVLSHRGTFDLGRPIDTGHSFGRANLLLNAGDFTGDGHGDVILRRRPGSLWLYGGSGVGPLAAPVRLGGRRAFRNVTDLRVVADVSGDGRHDLIGVRPDGGAVAWPGRGARPLGSAYPIKVGDDSTSEVGRSGYDWRVTVNDLQRRGRADLVVRDLDGSLHRLDGTRHGYGPPRYLGEARGYDLAG